MVILVQGNRGLADAFHLLLNRYSSTRASNGQNVLLDFFRCDICLCVYLNKISFFPCEVTYCNMCNRFSVALSFFFNLPINLQHNLINALPFPGITYS